MKSSRILTRKLMGLDYRIWRVMILVIILAAGLMSYRLLDPSKCIPVEFNIKNGSQADSVFYTNQFVYFTALQDAEDLAWDFKDNSATQQGRSVMHRFTKEGYYYVKLTVNSDCYTERRISIVKDTAEEAAKVQIEGNPSTYVGVKETFTCLAKANFYEWTVEDHAEYPVLTGPAATYKFLGPGDYTIKLTLDKNQFKKYRKTINVVENAKPKVADKIVPLIDFEKLKPEKTITTDENFREYLGKVITGEKTAKDFDEYLCQEGSTPVVMNGKGDQAMTFIQACAELTGKTVKKNIFKRKRAARITSVRLNRNSEKCVVQIDIWYK